jgi:hypothetical protein
LSFSASFTNAQPIEAVPKSNPKIFFILFIFLVQLFYLSLYHNLKLFTIRIIPL